jgi:hypothetical protein
MAMFAKPAVATHHHSGLHAPMHHVASTVIARNTRMSMQNAMATIS